MALHLKTVGIVTVYTVHAKHGHLLALQLGTSEEEEAFADLVAAEHLFDVAVHAQSSEEEEE